MSVDLFGTTKRSLELQAKLRAFMDEHIYPRETVHYKHMTSSEPHRWTVPTWIPELQAKAKAQGLWNLFLPIETDGGRYGASLTNLEYAPLAEIMGRVPWAPDIFNCGYEANPDAQPHKQRGGSLTQWASAEHPTRATWRYSLATARSNRRPSGCCRS